MRPYWSVALMVASGVLASVLLITDVAATSSSTAPLYTPDSSGMLSNVSTRGAVVDTSNPFFLDLGTNGRRCVTCHVPDQAWSISPADIQRRFAETSGTDPLFRTNDGSNAPNADVSTLSARRHAYSMLLNKGLIRVGIGIPSDAEFQLVGVDDPYGYASVDELSLFRRPLPSTNLDFLNAVMWDGRETVQKLLPSNTPEQNATALRADLAKQSNDATRGHAQASRDLTPAEQQQIVDFETSLYTAQSVDAMAGILKTHGATGGAAFLSAQPSHVGINDLVANMSTTPPTVVPPAPGMTLFASWASSGVSPVQRSVARGEALFNSRRITISGVAGFNDFVGMPAVQGTCSTCHNTPNVGNHSVALPLNIGIADSSRRSADLPLYTLRNRATGAVEQTTDPGRALITGKWADVGKFKGPVLRGLAARAPYFHNGSAASLDDVVEFYDKRFAAHFTAREHADLVAFLRSL